MYCQPATGSLNHAYCVEQSGGEDCGFESIAVHSIPFVYFDCRDGGDRRNTRRNRLVSIFAAHPEFRGGASFQTLENTIEAGASAEAAGVRDAVQRQGGE